MYERCYPTSSRLDISEGEIPGYSRVFTAIVGGYLGTRPTAGYPGTQDTTT